MYDVTVEITRVRTHDRVDNSGKIRSYFGYANAPEGIDGNAEGGIAVSLLTPNATMRDAGGLPITDGSFVTFSDVELVRKLDQDDKPASTGQRETPVYSMRLTATSGAKLTPRGVRFDEAIDEAVVPEAVEADTGE